MKRNKMQEMNEKLARVQNYMDTFGIEYLLVNNDLVAYNGNKGLEIYNPRDTRKVARCHETLVMWDNYRSNRVHITQNVMNIFR